MREYLSDRAYKSLCATIINADALDEKVADEIAEAMKTWALEKGATHFTHWFQPLNDATAEKHDSFFEPDRQGGVLTHFSGRQLAQGEPDASSFPTGGLRATFEARGYTAWDPTSPAFIKESDNGAVLCIPSFFCDHHCDALDKKTPLMRSQHALAVQMTRMAKLFGIETKHRPHATLGIEQEYFLIDRDYYLQRPDLIQTGRTLFGARPPRHQQMEDHYFGRIRLRVLAFMNDLDRTLWKLGVPAKTRHNEVSPGQFELVPVFEEQNLANDHNMLAMQIMQEIAEQHGFACLLHEKPFAGVNGSGKHNNWSVTGTDGKNWMSPGATPHENAIFLTMIVAMIKAVDAFGDLLRMTVACSGNDHRLGAGEAPPAIMSIYLGEQLTDIINQIENGGAKSSKSAGKIELGVSTMPALPRDTTDRNRTSPIAYTGNKLEFRAIGASQNSSGANVALNTIMAWALDSICTDLEKSICSGEEFNASLSKILSAEVKAHRRILFDGDCYSTAWKREAAERGLSNFTTTPKALEILKCKKVVELFTKYNVLSVRELNSRYEIYSETYRKTIALEAECALRIIRTMIIPSGLTYLSDLAVAKTHLKATGLSRLAKRISQLIEILLVSAEKIEAALQTCNCQKIRAFMSEARLASDELENLVPKDLWPMPTYSEMLFII